MKKLFKNRLIIMLGIFGCLSSVMSADNLTVQKLEELENEILDMQINEAQDLINWSGEFETSHDQYDSEKQIDGTTLSLADPATRNTKIYRSTLTLNANMALNSKLNTYIAFDATWFHNSRLFVEKTTEEYAPNNNSGFNLQVVKAYFDYSITKDLIFSVGRLPTMKGPPTHFYLNEERQGTYPLLMYSVPLDGIALTWNNLDRHLSLPGNLALRTIYSPIVDTDTYRPWDGAILGYHPDDDSTLIQPGYMLSQIIEYNSRQIPFVEHLNLILHGMYANFPRMQSELIPYLDGSIFEYSLDNATALKYQSIVAHLELSGVGVKWLDLFVQAKKSWNRSPSPGKVAVIHDEGYFYDSLDALGVSMGMNPGDLPTAQGCAAGDCSGVKLDQNHVYLQSSMGDKTGSSVLYGVKVKHQRSYLGAEMIHSTIGALGTSHRIDRATNLYNIIGKGYHVFAGYRFQNQPLSLRLGYSKTESEFEFTSPYIYVPSEREIGHVYVSARVLF